MNIKIISLHSLIFITKYQRAMLQVAVIRDHLEEIKQALKKRNLSSEQLSLLDKAVELDDRRKAIKLQMDQALTSVNKISKEIGKLYATGNAEAANAKKAEVASFKVQSQKLEGEHKELVDALQKVLFELPNRPHSSVLNGASDEDNEVVKTWSADLPELHEGALPHWELGEKYNLFDLKLGVRITGAGFPLYRGKGARLQRALINFFIDEAVAAGYEEIMPPLLVNAESAMGTGSLPDKEGQMYYMPKDDLYLIPTAELPLTNIVRGDILSSDGFPYKFCGHTPCFRREAGSYGADVKGLNRVHQFDKVEIVQIQHPDKSYETLDEMVKHVETILTKLELPYRILRLCGGDLTFASALTYDFEVYSAAQKRWLEVSSVSNFETFQANRLKTRYKDENGKTQLVHTLNGSALALARIVASMLENHQTKNGIVIPQALRRYTGFDIIN